MITITAVPTSSRSAVGSSTLPTVETWWKRRATNPSTQSVAPSTASRIAAGRLLLGPEDQPDEHRQAGQPERGDEVGDGEDAAVIGGVVGDDTGRRGPHGD